MKLHWTEWAALAALLVAGCVAIYAELARTMRRAVAERQRETERQLNAMETTVKALQARVAEIGREQTASVGDATANRAAESQAQSAVPPKPEILAALTAAATAYVGKKARIRSAVLVPAEENGADAWAQQGRVIVQTSHNLRPNG